MTNKTKTVSKTTHTPGPWTCEPSDRNRQGENAFLVLGPGRCYIATVDASEDDLNGDDARLIAAAPELLEQIKNALTFIEALGYTKGGDVHDDIAAAIAKAEGR